ncbi:P-loop NTPase fold protein [Aliikangiella sp. G2MR2-5]|uniref:P-loop NTPase fold protein n=1 Tax=Aliikangiella sp. G2MR2-5 TaxID=2788943 RepID=UPI0018A970A1|nr:P-loop NTPase fold protein [Aliikangiella sp. G2MR2-5]
MKCSENQKVDLNEVARHLWFFCQQEKIEFDLFSHSLQQAYLPLLTQLYSKYLEHRENNPHKAFVVGINGAQGSGKSTLARLLNILLKSCFSLEVLNFSIDDLYLSGEDRAELADKIHPLLKKRGVPGTHNVALGISLLRQLSRTDKFKPVKLPLFDKSRDEPCTPEHQRLVTDAPQIIIFEGWCVATPPESDDALRCPINELEKTQDPEGKWRRWVNQQLKENYQSLFVMIDYLIFLKAPNWEVIAHWRNEQEEKLISQLARSKQTEGSIKTMNQQEIIQFISLFERLTRHSLIVLDDLADITITLNQYRSPKPIDFEN